MARQRLKPIAGRPRLEGESLVGPVSFSWLQVVSYLGAVLFPALVVVQLVGRGAVFRRWK